MVEQLLLSFLYWLATAANLSLYLGMYESQWAKVLENHIWFEVGVGKCLIQIVKKSVFLDIAQTFN